MTLSELIRKIEVAASGTPSVSSIVRNDIFRLNSLPNAEYAVFGWTQGQHYTTVTSSLITYNFTFFYIDRLRADKRNELEIQSVGIQVLDNLIRTLELNECAGVFTNVALTVPVSDLCEETYADFNDDFNVDFAIGNGGVKIY